MISPPRAGAPPGGIRVGNDVVDLAHRHCRSRPSPDPLPERILTASEHAWLEYAPSAEAYRRRLWSLWAGKETAFKVVSKLLGAPPVFRHRSFEVELAEQEEGEGFHGLEGMVRWAGRGEGRRPLLVRLEGGATRQFVHLAGWGPVDGGGRGPMLEAGVEGWASGEAEEPEPASAAEREGVHGTLSRRARAVARARLLGHLRARGYAPADGRAGPRVEILTSGERPGRTPPRVLVDGRHRPELDLSLSHHGRYVGWALLLSSVTQEGRPQSRGR